MSLMQAHKIRRQFRYDHATTRSAWTELGWVFEHYTEEARERADSERKRNEGEEDKCHAAWQA